jgi:hypothetical protein
MAQNKSALAESKFGKAESGSGKAESKSGSVKANLARTTKNQSNVECLGSVPQFRAL